jgi:hypothetical protein
VPSALQFVTAADTLRNIGSAWRATTSAASLKLLQLWQQQQQNGGADGEFACGITLLSKC